MHRGGRHLSEIARPPAKPTNQVARRRLANASSTWKRARCSARSHCQCQCGAMSTCGSVFTEALLACVQSVGRPLPPSQLY